MPWSLVESCRYLSVNNIHPKFSELGCSLWSLLWLCNGGTSCNGIWLTGGSGGVIWIAGDEDSGTKTTYCGNDGIGTVVGWTEMTEGECKGRQFFYDCRMTREPDVFLGFIVFSTPRNFDLA